MWIIRFECLIYAFMHCAKSVLFILNADIPNALYNVRLKDAVRKNNNNNWMNKMNEHIGRNIR